MTRSKANILIGITGSIAAYKIADLISKLKQKNYDIRCVLTRKACHFITPLTIQTMSQNMVMTDDNEQETHSIDHIELIKWADLILIAPATANFLAKAAHGIADDTLSSLFLAVNQTKPILIAPAMNKQMFVNPITSKNIDTLKQFGVIFLESPWGNQACGDIGYGRMLEPSQILEAIEHTLRHSQSLSGKKVLITAGPTQEFIDPVRFISNHSSGKMGYALANSAVNQGAEVLVISGPTAITPPRCSVLHVCTSEEMHQAVLSQIVNYDIFISCAAVADYKPETVALEKIKKHQNTLTITLAKTTDILSDVAIKYPDKIIVGFAAETSNLEENAKLKLKTKLLDIIVANHTSTINSDESEAIILNKANEKTIIAKDGKAAVAAKIIDYIANYHKPR